MVRTTPGEPIAEQVAYVTPQSGPAIHLRQDADGSVTLGERSQEWVADDPSREHAEMLLRQATQFWPALADSQIERFTIEWRPMPADGLPIIGPAPGFPSLYVAAMHSGVTLAPAVGELIAKELAEGKRLSPLAPFRVERFDVRHIEMEQDVDRLFGLAPDLFLG
jgi:glycine/D-amino acid oxidase-like deaminating enzyme